MAKTARNLTVAVLVAVAAMAIPQASMAAVSLSSTVTSQIRTSEPMVKAVMQSAVDRSATFRKMVAIIDASDSYVYVEEGKCSHSVRACFVSVTASSTNRYMRVLVDS